MSRGNKLFVANNIISGHLRIRTDGQSDFKAQISQCNEFQKSQNPFFEFILIMIIYTRNFEH